MLQSNAPEDFEESNKNAEQAEKHRSKRTALSTEVRNQTTVNRRVDAKALVDKITHQVNDFENQTAPTVR